MTSIAADTQTYNLDASIHSRPAGCEIVPSLSESGASAEMLTPDQIEEFITRGFVRLHAAFSRLVADECVRLMWGHRSAGRCAENLDPANNPTSSLGRRIVRRCGEHGRAFMWPMTNSLVAVDGVLVSIRAYS